MAEHETIATSAVAVHRDAWTGLAPDLAVLVAPPVTVSLAPARSRVAVPVRRARTAAR